MKKIIALILASLMVLFALAACGAQKTADETKADAETTAADSKAFKTVEEGKLHMATNAAFPPYEMTTDDGGFEGIDVEIATAIAEKLGLELVVDDMEFDSVITSVQNGKDDIVMAGLTVNEERKQNVNFTNTYAKGVQVIIVPNDSDITNADGLAGKKIGVQVGTTGMVYCEDDFGAENVISYPNGATAVEALKSGKVDAVVIDNNPAKEFVKVNSDLKILETAYADEDYAIGVSKDNDALLEAVNNALVELQKDGTVDKIIAKYITAE